MKGGCGQIRNHAKTCKRHLQEELPQFDFEPRCDPQTRACTFLSHLGDENTGRADGGLNTGHAMDTSQPGPDRLRKETKAFTNISVCRLYCAFNNVTRQNQNRWVPTLNYKKKMHRNIVLTLLGKQTQIYLRFSLSLNYGSVTHSLRLGDTLKAKSRSEY